jgi:hypothetical protein
MSTHTYTLKSLSLIYPYEEDIDVAAASSRLKKQTTVRELTLELSRSTMISTSMHDLSFEDSAAKRHLQTYVTCHLLVFVWTFDALDSCFASFGTPSLGSTVTVSSL